jgi:hypothetical protein
VPDSAHRVKERKAVPEVVRIVSQVNALFSFVVLTDFHCQKAGVPKRHGDAR